MLYFIEFLVSIRSSSNSCYILLIMRRERRSLRLRFVVLVFFLFVQNVIRRHWIRQTLNQIVNLKNDHAWTGYVHWNHIKMQVTKFYSIKKWTFKQKQRDILVKFFLFETLKCPSGSLFLSKKKENETMHGQSSLFE